VPYFRRTTPAPVVTGGYQAYRPYVRADFREQCAYCLLHELWAGGDSNFELDHFRPKSLFPREENDFYNLYYACHPCNRTKWGHWPPTELRARGIQLVDLCRDDFVTHFREEPDGTWTALTDSAAYTSDLLRLNRRHLVELRQILKRHNLPTHRSP